MIYDLTHTLTQNTPVYPGDPHVRLDISGRIETDGFSDRVLTVGTHNGTHLDAPAHMLANGKALKDFPIESFVVDAVCVDVRNGFNAQLLDQSILKPGMGVTFLTGTSDYFSEERYWHDYPVLEQSIVDQLIAKQVSLVGIDTGSFDIDETFPVHKALLGAGMLLVENLTSLTPLANQQFTLYALPLKLEHDGAPARVIGVL